MWELKEREPVTKWEKNSGMERWKTEKEGKQRDGTGAEKLQQRLDIK